MISFTLEFPQVFAFVLALLLGALVGCEREISYRSRENEDSFEHGGRAFAGARSFALISLFGAMMGFLSSLVGMEGFFPIALGFIALVVLIAIVESHSVFVRNQPGITTTISLFLSYFLGVLTIFDNGRHQSIAIVLALTLTMILATKKHIRTFFDRVDHYEFLDALKFGVILFVILPLLPNEKFGATPFTEAFFNPYSAWKFVVIMTGIGYIGYLLKKIIGPNGGIQLSGLIGGLISSTAVTSAMAQASREDSKNPYPYLIATLLANAVMFVRVTFMVAVFHLPLLLGVMIYPMLTIVIVSIIGCVFFFSVARKHGKETRQLTSSVSEKKEKSPFQILPALKFAALLATIQFVVALVQHFAKNLPPEFEAYANYIISFVAGFTDVDAITSTMSSAAEGGKLSLTVAGISILLAVAANTVTKVFLAASFASRPFKVGLIAVCSAILASGAFVMFLVSTSSL